MVFERSKVPIQVVNVEDIKIYTDVRYSDTKSSAESSSFSITPTKKTSLFNLFESPTVADKIHSPEPHSLSSTSPTEYFLTETVVAGEKLRTKSAFLAPNLEIDDKKKRKSSRQNLAHFIHTIHNTRPKAELERENAHFHLSEAIIAACTQIKWNKNFDEKYKIPRDCRIKQALHHTVSNRSQPPPKIRTKFTIGSVEDDTSSSQSSDDILEKQRSASESDDASVPQMEWNSQLDVNSPESIAISLMSKFRHQKLPSANNLLWMVSESQAPQSLLPLPDSFPINPDENLNFNAIRGHQFWAPPRQQIIFTVHPPPDRKRQMLSQGNRCAGCGMKVSAAYVHKFRYCDYTSKFFCTACHKLQVSTIPARVLEKWDFTLNPVSNFAYKWLDQIWSLPLFHVSDLNPKLYARVKQLSAAREARLQLKYVIDFINQCRFAEKEKETIKRIPQHWIEDVDIWSMLDFMNVKNGIFTSRIYEIIKSVEEHILKNNCEVRKI
jgi:run domain Beclin-1 interacting cysteine-rich containing protein